MDFLRWLRALEARFDEKSPALAQALEALARRIFTRARLTASLTGSNPKAGALLEAQLTSRLPAGSYAPPEAPAIRPWGRRREGIVIPADVF